MLEKDLLGHLHDCHLLSVDTDIEGEAEKNLSVLLKCPEYIEVASWAGRRITLTFRDIFLLKYVLIATGGIDSISSAGQDVSQEFAALIKRSEQFGIVLPPARASIAFNSGTLMEIVCKAYDVVVT